MSGPLHVLICGDIGVGKSTLIEKLLHAENRRPICGFITKKTPEDENGVSKVYIHPANAVKRQHTAENLIGTCTASHSHGNPAVFDAVGTGLLHAPPEGLLLMDELGFMENKALVFCMRVLQALEGKVPVLAAVKNRETPFLKAVREHPNARLFWITREKPGRALCADPAGHHGLERRV